MTPAVLDLAKPFTGTGDPWAFAKPYLASLTERTGRLSAREHDVLIRMASGATNKEIAGALKIGTRTVDSHVERIYQKLGARGRADAIAYALQAGLVESVRPPA